MKTSNIKQILVAIALVSVIGHAAETPPRIAASEQATAVSSNARPSILGTISDTEGNPVPGATVFVASAWPKVGRSVLCPSCYADCAKQAVTDAQGRFRIDNLSSDLGFQLLAAAKGFSPVSHSVKNPGGESVSLEMNRPKGGETPDKRATGRVIDPQGNPVAGASIECNGVTVGSTTSDGSRAGVESIAITDAEGTFVMNATKPFDSVSVVVCAKGWAPVRADIRPAMKGPEIRLNAGVSVSGILMHEGKPLAGATMGLVQTDRASSGFFGAMKVATAADGRFTFYAVPGNSEYQLHGVADSTKEIGGVPSRVIKTGDTGVDFAAGEITLVPGYTLAGRVRLTDNKALPAHTRLMLTREDAWDQSIVELPSDGSFRFLHVTAGVVNLRLGLDGYRPTVRNSSNPHKSTFTLGGTISGDKTNLVLEFEPGPLQDRSELFASMPLQGAETLLPTNLPEQDAGATKTRREAREAREGQHWQNLLQNAKPARFEGRVVNDETPAKPVAEATITIVAVDKPQARKAFHFELMPDSPLLGKTVVTDSDGRFDLGELPPNINVSAIVIATSTLPGRIRGPNTTDAPACVLEKASATAAAHVCGVVVSENGPIQSALVEISGWMHDGKRQYPSGYPITAATEATGRFELPLSEPFEKASIRVSARGFAPAFFDGLTPDDNARILKMVLGARVTGRLIKDGKPFPGIAMIAEQQSKRTNTPCVSFTGMTDADGSFTLEHLVPGLEYQVMPQFESISPVAACSPKHVPELKDGQLFNAGTLEAEEGVKLSGRVYCKDGKLPAFGLILSHPDEGNETPWDTLQVQCDETGRFNIPHVKPGTVTLRRQSRSYRLTNSNISASDSGGSTLSGRLAADKTDLVIEIEPDDSASSSELPAPPLHGAETSPPEATAASKFK